MSIPRLEYLFECYIQQICSEKEEVELMNLLATSENRTHFERLIDRVIEKTATEEQMPDDVTTAILKNILHANEEEVIPSQRSNIWSMRWFKISAAVLLVLFASSLIYWSTLYVKRDKPLANNALPHTIQTPIQPGTNRAILTLGDGRTIELDSLKNGNIVSGNSKIIKQGASLVYDASQLPTKGTAVGFNTLSTPRGGQYNIVLPDGSKVWLNASSSLHFPTAFTGNTREVELVGEGYFEIAANKEKPFYVNVNGMQIEVLGTRFNVNAYANENAIKTSLLSGSVKIKMGNTSSLLKPGQQGIVKKDHNDIEVAKVDVNEAIAWKNGLFQFDNADIKTIMRQISRWYDVEVAYEGKIPDRRFEGKITREAQLSDVLRILELSGIKFSIQGKEIIVQ
jgi:ferric-dicitrate binding protein FerR (iron transport regulator)